MATPFRLKRSAVSNKRPALADLELGELAFNFYDGHLFAERDTGGVGIGTTIALLTPWKEEYGGGTIGYTGVVTASTYEGDQLIGTPSGGSFRGGAYSPTNKDKTQDAVDELNYILGKLVPSKPDTIGGVSIDLTNDTEKRLCDGFTPTNNTGGSAPVAGNLYVRNTTGKITTDTLTQYGDAASGTLTAHVNGVSVGSTALKVSFGLYDAGTDNGTYNPSGISSTLGLQILNEKDAVNSTRNAGIASLFYEVMDLKMLDVASPDGYNKAHFTHGSDTSGSTYWYEDPSTVSAPSLSISTPTIPSSPTLNYSSGVPHYTQASANAFVYVISCTNASGDMYNSNTFCTSSGQTSGFQNAGNKNYTNFALGANPPVRNYGVGSAVTCLISQQPRNLHISVSTDGTKFSQYTASTPYGSGNDRATLSQTINIMGTSADWTNNVDEDAIECTVGSLTNGSATRVNAGAASDVGAGTSIFTAFNASATPAVYEAIVRGGDLRHDVTNYSTGYLPVGPNLSSGRSGSQYFQMKFTQSAISGFNISYSGSLEGCWVCMPNNADWMEGLSTYGGWANMFLAAPNAGAPRNAFPGCSSGGVMNTSTGTVTKTCTFGTETSSNSTGDDVILVRFKLISGDSISDISFSDT